jgi:hypothetical protein
MRRTGESGREREAKEIARYQRAAEVGRLMLGDLRHPMKWIFYKEYLDKPRRELRERREAIRSYLRGEVDKFCKTNFENVKPEDLAGLYEPLYARGSSWRLPLTEFVQLLGHPREGVLKGAPLHSTVCLSYLWGLQTEFPEMHLIKDLAYSFNRAVEAERKFKEYDEMPRSTAKTKKKEIAELVRSGIFHRRMCVLSCFNLVEAYINGLAWAYVQTQDISSLSNRKQKVLTEGQTSILDKLVRIPQIITGRSPGPLEIDREPLSIFRDTIKPFRDSIVHASPFAAPERFGGYEKLSKVYELNLETVRQTVDMTLEIIGRIHRFVGGNDPLPQWVHSRRDNGTFEETG